jgi:hypothetical protein
MDPPAPACYGVEAEAAPNGALTLFLRCFGVSKHRVCLPHALGPHPGGASTWWKLESSTHYAARVDSCMSFFCV